MYAYRNNSSTFNFLLPPHFQWRKSLENKANWSLFLSAETKPKGEGADHVTGQKRSRQACRVSSQWKPDMSTLEQRYDCSHNHDDVYTNVMLPACFFSVSTTLGGQSIVSPAFLKEWAASQSSLQRFYNTRRRVNRLFSVSETRGAASQSSFQFFWTTGRPVNCLCSVSETVGGEWIVSSVFLRHWAASQPSLKCFWDTGRPANRLFRVFETVGEEWIVSQVFLRHWAASQLCLQCFWNRG
jgi:hypothetical protein